MKLQSSLAPKAYIQALSERMGSFIEFGHERFTGYFCGRIFYVTHHAGYEWNRRITNQKNAALGYVRNTPDGCQVCFLRMKGLLCPGQFLFTFLLLLLITLIASMGYLLDSWYGLLMATGIAFVATAVSAPITTLMESFTEESRVGADILITLLMDPADPFSYLRNKDKIS